MTTYNIDLISNKTGEIITRVFPINAAELIELVSDGYTVYDMTNLLDTSYYYNIPESELTIENVNTLVELIDDLDYNPENVLDLMQAPNEYDSIESLIKGLMPYDLECEYDIECESDYALRELENSGLDSLIYDYVDLSAYGTDLLDRDYSHYSLIENYGLLSCGGWYSADKPADLTYMIQLTDEIIKAHGKPAYLVMDTSVTRKGYTNVYAISLNEYDAILLSNMDMDITYYEFTHLDDIADLLDNKTISIDDLNELLECFIAETDNDLFFKSTLSLREKAGVNYE